MPMGLATAPAIFQRFINPLLAPVSHFTFAYPDDILVYSNSRQNTRTMCGKCLISSAPTSSTSSLTSANGSDQRESPRFHLRPRERKCAWPTDKIQASATWQAPRNLSELRMVLGKMQWVSGVMPDFADVAAVLSDLQKKDAKWDWTPTTRRPSSASSSVPARRCTLRAS